MISIELRSSTSIRWVCRSLETFWILAENFCHDVSFVEPGDLESPDASSLANRAVFYELGQTCPATTDDISVHRALS